MSFRICSHHPDRYLSLSVAGIIYRPAGHLVSNLELGKKLEKEPEKEPATFVLSLPPAHVHVSNSHCYS